MITMKTQLFNAFKGILLVTGILLCQAVQAQVTLVTEVEPGSYGNPDIAALTGDACLLYSSGTGIDRDFELTGTGLYNLTYTWSVKGGISLQGTSGNQATIRPIVDAQGRYNKGRLKVLYKGVKDTTITVDCNGTPKQEVIQIPKSGTAYVDLYQKFTFTEQIVGNVCVAMGDSNAYSIKDLVSGNIADGIGIDSYYWTFTDLITTPATIDPFDNAAYVSGDSSAITFRFIKDPEGGEQILVGVGKCNTADAKKVKTLGRKLPPADAEITPAGCIPVSTTQISISNDAQTGIIYEWVLGNSNFTYAGGTGPNSPNGITVNIGTYAGDIYLISSPDPMGSTFCGDNGKRVDTLHVIRSLDNSVSVTGPDCVAPGTYTYSVSPNPGTPLDWKFPTTGFSIVGGSANQNASTIQVIVASNAVSGNIVASTTACTSDTVYMAVNIKPGDPGIITGDTCLTPGDQTVQNYSISAVSPAATSYAWTKPNNWTGSSTTTSIALTPDANSTPGTITVQAIGQNGCNSDAISSVNINYIPEQPDSIVLVSPTCIRSGKKDTLTLEVLTPVAGLTYTWEVPVSWTILTNSNTQIVVETNETDDDYLVRVKGSNTCGDSPWKNRNIEIEGLSFTVRENDLSGGGSRAYYDIEDADTDADWYDGVTYDIKWTWINNLGVRTDVTDGDYTPSTLTRTNFQGFVTGSMTTQALCVDVVVNATGCFTRRCFGADPIPGGNDFRIVNESSESVEVEALSIFPNPAQSSLTVSIAGNKGSSIKLIDVNGTTLLKSYSEEENTAFNVSEIPAGLYTIIVSNGKNDLQQRVVITK